MIRIMRVYVLPKPVDGIYFLVDRFWPRGVTKVSLGPVLWLREAAPSRELCAWYGHEPARWEEFCRRYFAELEANPAAWQPLVEAAGRGDVTLLFSARDEEHSNATALKHFLDLNLTLSK